MKIKWLLLTNGQAVTFRGKNAFIRCKSIIHGQTPVRSRTFSTSTKSATQGYPHNYGFDLLLLWRERSTRARSTCVAIWKHGSELSS
eukprot:scaffold42409_cov214-Amphora_coffeaeformis.AAC.2